MLSKYLFITFGYLKDTYEYSTVHVLISAVLLGVQDFRCEPDVKVLPNNQCSFLLEALVEAITPKFAGSNVKQHFAYDIKWVVSYCPLYEYVNLRVHRITHGVRTCTLLGIMYCNVSVPTENPYL